MDYSFAITFNNFKLLAINSRTERGLVQTPNPQLGPALLHPQAMQRQVQQNMRNLPSSVQVVLVICPAPVFGHAIVEGLGQKGIAKVDNTLATLIPTNKGIIHRLSGTNPGAAPFVDGENLAVETDWNELDREGWSFNEECMESLLKELSVGKKVVLFSGDVHYGFSPYVSYQRRPSTATPTVYPEKAAFIQLVCSSMKNSLVNLTNRGAAIVASDLLETLYPFGNTYAGWSGRGYHYYRHLLVDAGPTEILQKPYTEFEGDFFFTSISTADDSLTTLIDAPDWSYTVKFARDERDTELRMAYPGADPNTAYTPPAGRLAKAQYTVVYNYRYNRQRLTVGHNQIGQVRLDLAQNKVYHNFWYTLPGQSPAFGPGPITQHIIPIPPI